MIIEHAPRHRAPMELAYVGADLTVNTDTLPWDKIQFSSVVLGAYGLLKGDRLATMLGLGGLAAAWFLGSQGPQIPTP